MADAQSDKTATMDHDHAAGSKVELKSGASSPAASVHDGSATPKGSGSSRDAPPRENNHLVTDDLPAWRFWAIFTGLLMSIFLFALDQLIIATAIPKITAEFNSLTQLSWLASGFFLPLLGLNLIYSQWIEIFPSKVVMMFAVFIFEVGSLVCGVAPNMVVLILGRAIAGAGAAGIFSGAIIVVSEISPLHKRPGHLALIGVCFAIASVIGPLVGGAFSDHVSWRWCFYINLPLGGVALAQLFFFQPMKPPLGRRDSWTGWNRGMIWQVLKCDYMGAAIAMGWAVSLILALQWGGVTKKWNDGSVIACLVLTGVLPVVFFLWEWWIGPERQMFKIHLIFRRTIFGASITLFMLFAVFMIVVYYMSINLQAVYRFSATDAGVRLLPLIMVNIFFLILSSRVLPKIGGRFKPIVVAGPGFLALGSGLLYTIKYGDPISRLYGYQVLLGTGIGLAMQNSMLGVQIELKAEPKYISAGMGMCTFVGFAGRIIGISLGGSVFENMIQRNLREHVPGLPESALLAVVNDATAVWKLPELLRDPVLVQYQKTLGLVYIIGVPLGVLGLLSALIMKDDRLPSKEETLAQDAAAKERAAAKAAAEKGDVEAAAGADKE